jgi:hypothetical protein
MKKYIINSSSLLLAVLLTFFSGCLQLPSDLVMPKWDVNINAPIINKTYTLHDMIKKQNNVYEDYSNNPQGIYLIESDTASQYVSATDFINKNKTIAFQNNSVPPVDGSSDFYIPFRTDSVKIDSAQLKTGTIELTVQNNSNVQVMFSITILNLIKHGTAFQTNVTVNAGNSVDITSYLNDYKYVASTNQQLSNENDLLVHVTTETNGTANLLTTVNFDIYISNFYFSYVEGSFPEISLGTQESNLNINLGDAKDYQGKTFLKTASLNLIISYLSKYTNNFILGFDSLTIVGHRSDGEFFYLRDSTGNKYLHIRISAGNNEVSFNENNSNIADFISFLPDQVSFGAKYILDGQGRTTTVSESDSVRLQGEFSAKSFLALKRSSITDTASIGLSSDDRDNISKGRAMNMNLQIDNGIPLTTWIYATFTDAYFNPLFTLKNNTTGKDSIYFQGADVDQNGEVSQNITTIDNITMDSSQVALFAKSYHIIYTVSVRTKQAYENPPPLVAIRPTAQLKLKAYGQIKYNLNPSDK